MKLSFMVYTYPSMTVFYMTINGRQFGKGYLSKADLNTAMERVLNGETEF